MKLAPRTETVVETYKTPRGLLEIVREENGDWRWRVVRKGRIISGCTEGYRRRAGMLASLKTTYGLFDVIRGSL